MISKNVVSLVIAVLESLLYSGVLFGWPFLVGIFEIEGYFVELCQSRNISTSSNLTWTLGDEYKANSSKHDHTLCVEQTEELNLIFTISSVLSIVQCFVAGVAFDKLGTWFCKLLMYAFFMASLACFALSTPATAYLLYPAMISLSTGCGIMYMVNMQFANFFGTVRSTLLTLFTGLYISSQFFFWLVRAAFDSGVNMKMIMCVYGAPLLIFCSLMPFFAPKTRVPFPLPKSFTYGVIDCKRIAARHRSIVGKDERKDSEAPLFHQHKKLNVFTRLGMTLYLLNMMHFTVINLRNFFFIGTFDTWIHSSVRDDDFVHDLIKWYGILNAIGGTAAPLAGLVDDLLFKRFQARVRSKAIARIRSATAFAIFATLTVVLLSACVLTSIPSLQYVSFLLAGLSRITCYSSSFITLSALFPVKHIGKLAGLTFAVGGIIALVQAPLLRFVLRYCAGDFLTINVIFLVICALTVIFPIQLRRSWKTIEAVLFAPHEVIDVDNNLPDAALMSGKKSSAVSA